MCSARPLLQIELSERLEELEFEVTDRLTMFLCGRTADHRKGVHFLIPEMTSPAAEQCREFRKRLQSLPSLLFEKLIQDVYDEVDRREVGAQWNAVKGVSNLGIYDSKHVAVFLPVCFPRLCHFLSPTRTCPRLGISCGRSWPSTTLASCRRSSWIC